MSRPALLACCLAAAITSLPAHPSFACAEFEAPVNYPHEGVPASIGLGDVNGDGIADLVASSRSFTVFEPPWYARLGLGDGTFGPQLTFPGGKTAVVAVADLDGDGFGDLVSAGAPAVVKTFRSRGDGTFDPPLTYPITIAASELRVGDVNGDSFHDVLVGHVARTIAVFLGDGRGGIARATDATVARDLAIFALSDLDWDGDLDIFTGYTSGFLDYWYLEGHGDGAFTRAGRIPGIHPTKQEAVIETGDLDGDGLLDVVVGHNTGNFDGLGVLLATAPGAWGPETIVPTTGGSVLSLVLADFDLDGKLDIVFVNLDAGDRVRVRLGNGDGSFGPDFDSWKTSPGSEVLHKIAVADLDRNGFPDIVFADRGPDPFVDPSQVAVVLNRGDRTPPMIDARLEPLKPLPPLPPRSVCSPPTSRTFRVVCDATDDTDPDPTVTALLRASHRERPTRRAPCAIVSEESPVACGDVVELRLTAPRCTMRTARAPRAAVSVNSAGIKVVTAESIVLEVRASDRCGNEATVEVDPTHVPSPLCDEVLEDGTCCPALAAPRRSAALAARPAAGTALPADPTLRLLQGDLHVER